MPEESCHCRVQRLTTRELDVVELLAQGLSTETVANTLLISHHTVTAHLGKMLRNLHAHNRTELIARMYACGVLASGEWPPRAISHQAIPVCQSLSTTDQSPRAPQIDR
jgi:DNA-binding CsgD family transcriptional regulator